MKKINLYSLLFEDDKKGFKAPPEGNVSFKQKSGSKRSSDSVDDQIDSLILMYEKNAIKNDDKKLYEQFLKGSLKMLLEQDDTDTDTDTSADTSTDTETDSSTTSSDSPSGSEDQGDVSSAKNDIVPNLDVDEFTEKIARLIMNYRNLLRIEDVIINRAKNFLDENYGDAFVSKYIQTLESDYGIEISIFPNDELERDAPFAIGANPAGAGGG